MSTEQRHERAQLCCSITFVCLLIAATCVQSTKRLSRREALDLHEQALQSRQRLAPGRHAEDMPLVGTSGRLPHHMHLQSGAAGGTAAVASGGGPLSTPEALQNALQESDPHTQFGGSSGIPSSSVRCRSL